MKKVWIGIVAAVVAIIIAAVVGVVIQKNVKRSSR